VKSLRIAGIVLFAVFVGIQFFPATLNQSDELLDSDIIVAYDAPNDIESMLRVSCYDCHSNNTKYPWYQNIQPARWIMERHIGKAREELNFSEFGNYSGRKQKSKLKSIASQINDGEMPLTSYTMIHRDAKLSNKKRQLLIEWVGTLRDGL